MIHNLLDRMKLPFRKNKEFLTALYDILGFYPHDVEVYRIAFSHKSLGSYRAQSAAKEHRTDRRTRKESASKPLNNERLEYLGDAVLETVVSDILFRHYPTKREGFLTSTRSKIVQREALNRLASDMGLEKLIRAAQNTRMSHTNIGGNAFEALMGAIYLDRGYSFCHKFIADRVIGHYVDLDNVAQKEVNFKSKLLEWSQKNRITMKFKDTENAGDHEGFTSVIVIEGIVAGRGTGRSKKESQQMAAREALTLMRRDAVMYDSLFRAKEKRTAMEAEESFALPKIDEIEETVGNKKRKVSPAKTEKPARGARQTVDAEAAYAAAYAEDADYEVIDTEPEKSRLTDSDYRDMGLPVPPAENELDASSEKPKQRRTRKAKTVRDAVKDFPVKDEAEAKKKEENKKSASAEKNKPGRRNGANGKNADEDVKTPDTNGRNNGADGKSADGNGRKSGTNAKANAAPAANDASDVQKEAPDARPADVTVVAGFQPADAAAIEEAKQKAIAERRVAQKAKYEAERARRAERRARREAAEEPLQVAVATVDAEPKKTSVAPVENASVPVEASPVAEKTDVSAEPSVASAEASVVPAEVIEAPAGESVAPAEKKKASARKAKAPAKRVEASAVSVEAPAGNAVETVENIPVSAEPSAVIADEAAAPTELSVAPADESSTSAAKPKARRRRRPARKPEA